MKFWFSTFFILVHFYSNAQTINATLYSLGFNEPIAITHCNDDRLFVAQQDGKIWVLDGSGAVLATPFLDISSKISTGADRGLLGLAFHPNYKSNGYFYLNYTKSVTGETIIARYQVSADSNVATLSSELIMLSVAQPFTNNNGGSMAFGPDGFLYVGMGDGGSGGDPGNRAQNTAELLGKILRLNVNGAAPYIASGNPYVGVAGAAGQNYSIGWRNPSHLSFDPVTGDLWAGDQGLNNEELNHIKPSEHAAANFGWKCWEGSIAYSTATCAFGYSATHAPVLNYAHITGSAKIIGGDRYRGVSYGSMYGLYLYGDYVSGKVWKINYNAITDVYTNTLLSGINIPALSAIGTDRYGEIYAASNSTGNIYHFTTSDNTPLAMWQPVLDSVGCIETNDSIRIGVQSCKNCVYTLLKDGVATLTGGNPEFYVAYFSGNYQIVVTNIAGISDTSSIQYMHFYDCVSVEENILANSTVYIQNQMLNWSIENMQIEKVQILDLNGKVLLQEIVQTNKCAIPINNLANGMYITKALIDGHWVHKKIAKSN